MFVTGRNQLRQKKGYFLIFLRGCITGSEDLAKILMAPANCRGSQAPLLDIYNTDFAVSEPVYVYTDIIKPNLVGDSYVRLLTPLHFPSPTWHHRFDYPLYRPVEQSYIESI